MKSGGGDMKTLPVYANNEVTQYWSNFMNSLSKYDSEYMAKPNWTDIIKHELEKYSAKLTTFNSQLEFEKEEFSSLFLLQFS